MSHLNVRVPSQPVVLSASNGQASLNALVSAYKSAPNPTLMSLLSNGTVSLGALNSSYSTAGWGGE